jgi:two-component system cell cycle response regulator
VDERARPGAAVAVGPDLADVAPTLRDAGFVVVEVGAVDEVEVHGEGAPVAVIVRWPVRHVGLGELGVPVLAWIDEGLSDLEAVIEDAVQRGVHDVLLAGVTPAELAARVRAAERTATGIRELQARSRTDELTGLANRRHLDEHLEVVSAMARRQRAIFSLLLIDVDRTRRINDDHGHTAGDLVLRDVSQRIVAALRTEDIAGRWHGEEFVVLLPHTELDGAWRLAERIRASVCDEPVDLGDGKDVMVSVSIGCAEGFGDDLEDHLRRAHAAVDEAKAAGRNKVIADTSPVLN